MADQDEQPKKLRRAQTIMPPNKLKEKVGSGGIDQTVVAKAQDMIETNTVDFNTTAIVLLALLSKTLEEAQTGARQGEDTINALLYPAMQLKAQGALFQYPLVTDIAAILIDFLETVETLD